MGRKSVYSNEFKQSVVEFYKTHTMDETAKEFSIPATTVSYFVYSSGYRKGCAKYDTDFKHEVCQYYDNHTVDETIAKFGITTPSLFEWRKTLGYRNKSRGYNLYTEQLQPVAQKRQRRDFMVTRDENGKLRADLAEITQKYVALEQQFTEFKTKIMEALQ